jgi:hypothetical protein
VEEVSGGGVLTTLLAVCVILTLLGGTGIAAAVLVPSFLRARSAATGAANENAALDQVQRMRSAQAAYAAANRGFYDRAECLAAPATCIPGYAAGGPAFLSAEDAAGRTNQSYRFTLHLGPPAPADAGPASPTSVASFAYLAQALDPRFVRYSYCADNRGLCAHPASLPLDVSAGVCPRDCGSF